MYGRSHTASLRHCSSSKFVTKLLIFLFVYRRAYPKIVILISTNLCGVKKKLRFRGAVMTIPNLVYWVHLEPPTARLLPTNGATTMFTITLVALLSLRGELNKPLFFWVVNVSFFFNRQFMADVSIFA